jgi:predicted nucleic acid-binding protein
MTVYVDTGVIVKSYVTESNSAEADAILIKVGTPLLFSHLHSIEIPNAIQLKRFRKEISKEQAIEALRAFQSDINSGRFQRPEYDIKAILHRAVVLSEKYSASIGTRSLDILHIATALETHCDTFISFDLRQRKIARQVGLKSP